MTLKVFFSRYAMIIILGFIILPMIFGCGNDGVGGHQGLSITSFTIPGQLDEYTEGSCSVIVEGSSAVSYFWSVQPETAGLFSDPESPTTYFRAAGVDQNIDVVIQVEVIETIKMESTSRTGVTKIIDKITTAPELREPEFMGMRLINVEGNVYTYEYWGLTPNIRIGDMISGTWQNEVFNRRVEDIQDTGTLLIITTSDVTLEEVIEEGLITITVDYSGDRDADSVRYVQGSDGIELYAVRPAIDIDLTERELVNGLDRGVLFDSDNFRLSFISDDQDGNSRIKFTPTIRIQYYSHWLERNYLLITADDADIELILKLLAEAQVDFSRSIKQSIPVPGGFDFRVGPFSVNGGLTLEAGCNVEINGGGWATTGYYYKQYGTEANVKIISQFPSRPKFESVYNEGSTHSGFYPIESDLSVDAAFKAYLKPQIGVDLSNSFEFTVDLVPYFRADGSGYYRTPPPDWCFTYDLFYGLTSDFRYKGSLFRIFNIDGEISLYNQEFPLCNSQPCGQVGTCGDVENLRPTVSITNCPGTLPESTSSYNFQWNMSDDETPNHQLKVEIKKNTENWQTLSDGSTSYHWNNIGHGNNTFQVKVTDNGSPPLSASSSCSFTRESPSTNTQPTVNISNCPGTLPESTTSYNFQWSMSDAETPNHQLKVEIKRSTENWQTLSDGSTSYNWNNIEHGNNTFQVRVTDNGSPPLTSQVASCSFVRESPSTNTQPTVNITNCPGTLPESTSSHNFIWTMHDAETPDHQLKVEIKRSTENWQTLSNGTTNYNWNNIEHGNNTFQVRVTDNGSPPLTSQVASCSFIRESPSTNTPPSVNITNCPGTLPESTSSYNFQWSMSDDETPNHQLKVEIKKNTENWQTLSNGTTNYNWNNIGHGNNTFQIKVTDNGSPPLSASSSCSFTRESPTTGIVGRATFTGEALGVHIHGNYAYVAARDGGLKVIDISNPVNPTVVRTVSVTGSAWGVYVYGSKLYLTKTFPVPHYGKNGLSIYNISSPSNPIFERDVFTNYGAFDVHVPGDGFAYLAVQTSDGGVRKVNLSTYTYEAIYTGPSTEVWGVEVHGSYIYAADKESGLTKILRSNTSNRTSIATGGLGYDLHVPGDGFVYVADRERGLVIINDSTNQVVRTVPGISSARHVRVSGNYAYVASWYEGLKIVNITNRSNAYVEKSISTHDRAHYLAMYGEYVCVADMGGGLVIIRP